MENIETELETLLGVPSGTYKKISTIWASSIVEKLAQTKGAKIDAGFCYAELDSENHKISLEFKEGQAVSLITHLETLAKNLVIGECEGYF